MSDKNSKAFLSIEELKKKIPHYNLSQGDKVGTIIFVMDENNRVKNMKGESKNIQGMGEYVDDTGRDSVAIYVGMDNWKVCDYLIIKRDKNNRINIFLIEETDLYSSIEDKDNVVDEEKHQCISSVITRALKDGIYYEKQPEEIIKEALKEYREDTIHIDLSKDKLEKLYSSLHMLCRLKEEKNLSGFFESDCVFHFILWNAFAKKKRHNIVQATIATCNMIATSVDQNIQSKSASKNFEKSIKIGFRGILNGEKENIKLVLERIDQVLEC